VHYNVVCKKCGTLLLSISSPIIDQFPTFFYRHTLQKICNNAIIIHFTTKYKCIRFVCVCWHKAYSCWFQILAGVRHGGILSHVLFAVMEPLIARLKHLGLGCRVLGELFECLFMQTVYYWWHIPSIPCISPCMRVISLQRNLIWSLSLVINRELCELVVDSMRSVQFAGKDIVSELKYLGVHVTTMKLLQF